LEEAINNLIDGGFIKTGEIKKNRKAKKMTKVFELISS